jgi:CBS domain-containing protein
LVVVEGEVSRHLSTPPILSHTVSQEEERRGGKKGRLMGIITLSDILRYIIGRAQISDINEVPQEVKKSTSDPTLKKSSRTI